MDYRAIFQISAAGMDFERRRVDAAALNLANMHSSRPAVEQPYAAQRVTATAMQLDFARHWQSGDVAALSRQVTLTASQATARLVHEPGHPHADARGFVAYPAIDHAAEMLTVSTAARAYEANVAVAAAARAMAAKALELGGQ